MLKLVRRAIDTRYPSWNLDAALRYLPVVDHLNRSPAQSVLDVGTGGAGLSRYWERETIGVDLHFDSSCTDSLLCRVRGSAAMLPFKNDSVDAVVSSDLLEHLPAAERTMAVSEMVRVARSEVIVAVPCGRASHLAEKQVNRIYRRRTGVSHPWLREHLRYGLPERKSLENEIRSIAMAQGKEARLEVKANVNLRLWRLLFGLYFSGGRRTARLLSYYFLAFIPLLRHMNWGTTYRKIFFVHLSTVHERRHST